MKACGIPSSGPEMHFLPAPADLITIPNFMFIAAIVAALCHALEGTMTLVVFRAKLLSTPHQGQTISFSSMDTEWARANTS